MKRRRLLLVSSILVAASFAHASSADVTTDQNVQTLIDKGLAYLKTQQKPDGGWQGEQDPPAITAIVLKAFVQHADYDANTDFVKKGYDKLLSYQVEDGGIYQDLLANYNTAIAISALKAAENPEFQSHIDRAVA